MSKTMEPYLMSVLSSRLYSIGLEMTNTLMRTARSQLMSVCHDLSTAICDRNGKVIALAESIPVHCANMGLTVSPCFSHPDGIQPASSRGISSSTIRRIMAIRTMRTTRTSRRCSTRGADVLRSHEGASGGYRQCDPKHVRTDGARHVRGGRHRLAVHQGPARLQGRRRHHQDRADAQPRAGDVVRRLSRLRRLAALCAEYGNEKIKEFCEAYQAYQAYGARSSSSCRRAITSTTSRQMPSRASYRRSRSTSSAIRIPRMGRSRLISRKTRTRCRAVSTCARRRRSRAR